MASQCLHLRQDAYIDYQHCLEQRQLGLPVVHSLCSVSVELAPRRHASMGRRVQIAELPVFDEECTGLQPDCSA